MSRLYRLVPVARELTLVRRTHPSNGSRRRRSRTSDNHWRGCERAQQSTSTVVRGAQAAFRKHAPAAAAGSCATLRAQRTKNAFVARRMRKADETIGTADIIGELQARKEAVQITPRYATIRPLRPIPLRSRMCTENTFGNPHLAASAPSGQRP